MTSKTTRIGVDIGGTFTDFVLHDETLGITRTGKRLSTPDEPSRAIIEGIIRLLDETKLKPEQIYSIVHGTTLITNTVLERTGAKVGLLTSRAFRHILEMGREIRYDTDDLFLQRFPSSFPARFAAVFPAGFADGSEPQPLDLRAVENEARYLVEEENIEDWRSRFSIPIAIARMRRKPATSSQSSIRRCLSRFPARLQPRSGNMSVPTRPA